MTNQEAFQIIGERAEKIADMASIKAKCDKMYKSGKTEEQIKNYVYLLAIGTLLGIGE